MRPARLLAVLVALAPALARGAGPLGAQGSPITTSQYTVDFFTGPVISSSRVTALGGAYAGIAEGVDADAVNPAAPAVRVPWSYDWFDYDLMLGLALPGALTRFDLDNSSDPRFRYAGGFVPSVGLNLTLGDTALGVTGDFRRYSVDFGGQGDAQKYFTEMYTAHVLLAHSFWRGQLVAGLGIRVAHFDLSVDGSALAQNEVFSMTAIAFETGLLLAPTDSRFRVGATVRLPGSGTPSSGSLSANADGDTLFQGLYLPNQVTVPWEIEAGFAWELGSRPLNPEWVNPAEYQRSLRAEVARARAQRAARLVPEEEDRVERATEDRALDALEADLRARRELAWEQQSRQRYLLTASVLVTGPVDNAVGAVGFLSQTVTRSGLHASVTPRLGLEAEPVDGWLQMRVGSYLEPGREAGTGARVHLTSGLDVKVFPFSVFGLYRDGTWWSVGAALDVADRYLNACFRFGVWH